MRVVWAPLPDRVVLELGEEHRPLVRDDEGWWSTTEPFAGPYRIVADGDPLPDPRSPWQPTGVDGPSHTVDHDAFAWTDQRWHGRPLASSVLYECHVGTFSAAGTFDGAIEHLAELRDLGVDAIEVMPVAEFPGRRGWGYDGVLLGAPHHAYGGPDGFKRFVDAAHAHDLAVVLDVVYNHLGPYGNHLARFGPYFTDDTHTPWGDAVNFDGPGSDQVRAFFIDNAVGWIRDYHVDGLRLDAVHAFVDRSATPFIEELTAAVHDEGERLGRQVWVIAENDRNDPRLVASREVNGAGLDAVWSDDFHHALHAALTGERDGYYADYGSLAALAKAITDVYVVDGCGSAHRGHRHGRPVGDLPRTRFLGYAQTHDQIGNRAKGERLSHLIPFRRAQVAAAIVLTSPFVPMLFQGEEWAASTPFLYFTDHVDPVLAQAVSEGRRREFGAFADHAGDVPDPQDPATAHRSVLDRAERHRAPHAQMWEWYRRLIELRARWCRGTTPTSVTFDEAARVTVIRRDELALLINLSEAPATVEVAAGRCTVLLANDTLPDEVSESVTLYPDGVAILATR